jgi:hypothetical protein
MKVELFHTKFNANGLANIRQLPTIIPNIDGNYRPPIRPKVADILCGSIGGADRRFWWVERRCERLKRTGQAKIGAKSALKKTCDLALAYINKLAKDLRESTPELIANATMELIEKNGIRKSDIKIKKLIEEGSYKLNTKAAMFNDKLINAIYYWQYAILVDGKKVWFDLDDTLVANTIAKGMSTTVMTWYRGRHKTKNGGMTPWYYDENNS